MLYVYIYILYTVIYTLTTRAQELIRAGPNANLCEPCRPPWAFVVSLGPCAPGPCGTFLGPYGAGRIYIGTTSTEYQFPLFIFLSTA